MQATPRLFPSYTQLPPNPTQSYSQSQSSPLTQSTQSYSFRYALPPPSTAQLFASLETYDPPIPSKLYQDPFYSTASDRPTRPVEVAGSPILIPGNGVSSLPQWSNDPRTNHSMNTTPTRFRPKNRDGSRRRARLDGRGIDGWAYAGVPPGQREVRRWLAENPVSLLEEVEGGRRRTRTRFGNVLGRGIRSQVCVSHCRKLQKAWHLKGGLLMLCD